MTVVLFSLSGISLLFISSSKIDPLAKQESQKARLPKYGDLEFLSKKVDFKGIDVGKEKVYRKYLAGGEGTSHRGVYGFTDVSGLSYQTAVPCEFSFDIFRLTKGEENRPIYTTFEFQSWKYDPAKDEEYKAAMKAALGDTRQNVQPPEKGDDEATEKVKSDRWKKINEIAKKYGRFEFQRFPLYTQRTYTILIPPGLFESASEGVPEARMRRYSDGTTVEEAPYRMRIYVRCDSASQMLGLAKYDLYLLEADGSYYLNYFKGAIGLWCMLVLVIGLAVICSTYFAGVISMLIALSILGLGRIVEFISTIASGINPGGGPLESLTKLARGEVAMTPLDKTPFISILLGADEIFRWVVRRVFNVLPDVNRFIWSDYLSEGFSLRPEVVIMNFLFLVGYLLPWFLIGYYAIKTREIAA
jgi:hypothetical protein